MSCDIQSVTIIDKSPLWDLKEGSAYALIVLDKSS